MLSIYTPSITPRLQYTLQFIFGEVLQCQYRIIHDAKNVEGPFICYGVQNEAGMYIPSSGLLFQSGIQPQELSVTENKGSKNIFSTNGNGYPFDVFSAIFYLISRYEEYLPHEKDLYGRYSHENSVAYNEGFLNFPLVDKWLNDLANELKAIYPEWKFEMPEFKFRPTYDIDMAWSYKHKGLFRNIGGWLSNPELNRWKVLLGLSSDPYDSLEWIKSVTKKGALYFILCANRRSKFDKNISLKHPAMQRLVKRIEEIGIHPSYNSSVNENLIFEEKKNLERAVSTEIISSRQHYLKFEMPYTFRALIKAGITNEYSMGYGTINGFRASTSHSFLWYDLEAESMTNLRMHPFCFMDANSIFEQQFSPKEISDELDYYYGHCKKFKGTLVTIFHNHLLGENNKELRKVYQDFLAKINQ